MLGKLYVLEFLAMKGKEKKICYRRRERDHILSKKWPSKKRSLDVQELVIVLGLFKHALRHTPMLMYLQKKPKERRFVAC